MNAQRWVIVDTETDGLWPPIHVVEIAAQIMEGSEPCGEPFQVFLNHDVFIPPAVVAIHGYTQEFLQEHGRPPFEAHEAFREYVSDYPIVAHNLGFDWNRALLPEWERLRIAPIGRRGFCTMLLSRRILFETASHALDSLRGEFGLGEGASHKALADVRTVVRLFTDLLRPRLESVSLTTFEEWAEFSGRTPLSDCWRLFGYEPEVKLPKTYYLRPYGSVERVQPSRSLWCLPPNLRTHLRQLANRIGRTGSLSEEDISALRTTFDNCAGSQGTVPGCRLDRWVERLFPDGSLDACQKSLFETALVRMASQGNPVGEACHSGEMPGREFKRCVSASQQDVALEFDTPTEIKFEDHSFCFTGEFAYGTREECSNAVLLRGATFIRRPTTATDYLVVGSLGGSGRKV